MSSPEDHPAWGKKPSETDVNAVKVCVSCKNQIAFWHCANLGCPWCAECGTNSKKEG